MKVFVEGAEVRYKGPREFAEGQKILDLSIPNTSLPDTFDGKTYHSYLHRFQGGAFYILGYITDMTLEIHENSFSTEGVARNNTANALRQVIFADHFQGKPIPVFIRHENDPYPATLRLELQAKSSVGESEAVKFVKQFQWPIGPYRYSR